MPGFLVVGGGVLAWFWSHSMPAHSAQDQRLYDHCLVQQAGNTVAYDAWIQIVTRRLAHERAFEAALYQQAAQLRGGV